MFILYNTFTYTFTHWKMFPNVFLKTFICVRSHGPLLLVGIIFILMKKCNSLNNRMQFLIGPFYQSHLPKVICPLKI